MFDFFRIFVEVRPFLRSNIFNAVDTKSYAPFGENMVTRVTK